MKLFVLTKKTVLLYTALLMFVVCIMAFNWSKTVSVFENSVKRDLPIYCVDKKEKICALSFDAAWGADDTQTLIKELGDYGVKTTFFVVGDWVDRFPDQVKSLHDAGHEIMNHSNTHPHMTQLSVEKMQQEVKACDEKIKAITGVEPNLFRPPYGDYNNDVVSAMRDIGHYTIQWSVDSLDWKDLSAQAIYERVTSRIEPGSIVLFHNAAKHTPEALPMILKYLKDNEYTVVPVSELIYKENFKIDNTGKQISNEADYTPLN
ncbi:MAG: polysaccharide deacetylase family protein [Clostridia bacterium]|nr:polysaccharide deacetylase family protein [Clostridia bacterium]